MPKYVMSRSQRSFRTLESYRAERQTRAMLPAFLRRNGFRKINDDRKLYGKTESQTIHALTVTGEPIVMRVKLCWRPDRKKTNREFSAAQLMARIHDDDWEGSIREKLENQRAEGVTHLLLVQRSGNTIRNAALVPLDAVLPIWRSQRDTSAELIKQGKLGRRRKNHAMNGSSPTIWLVDEAAPSVAAKLWEYPGVIDVGQTGPTPPQTEGSDYDDLSGIDLSLIGSDSAERVLRLRSSVVRDKRVRMAVLKRASGVCEREGCGASRGYSGFLDVHHVIGAAKSDRVFNCVAICPNCHREAHLAPDSEAINAALLAVAETKR